MYLLRRNRNVTTKEHVKDIEQLVSRDNYRAEIMDSGDKQH